jgi:hypothetical protein
MNAITQTMPLLASQMGVWEGEYVHLNADHVEIDRHKSRLLCRLDEGPSGEARLIQTNIYDWPDGSREVRYFVGVLDGDRVNIRNENIEGWVAPLAGDVSGRTIMVLWIKTGEPDFRNYEMITVSDDGKAKNRTWHTYRAGALLTRTIINERHVGHDWQAFDDPSFYAYRPRAAL